MSDMQPEPPCCPHPEDAHDPEWGCQDCSCAFGAPGCVVTGQGTPPYASLPNRRLCVVAGCDYGASGESGYCTLHGIQWDRPAYRCNCGEEFPSHLARTAHAATCLSVCCNDGPGGHTQQEHHDASPCYDQACPFDHPNGGPFPHPCGRHPHTCRCDNCQHDAMTEQESQR